MTPRKKNLLEALRTAGEARVSGIDDRAPQPVASKPALPRPAEVDPKPAAPSRRSGGRRVAVPRALVLVAALGLAFVGGVVVGRQTTLAGATDGGEVAAQSPLEIDPLLGARTSESRPESGPRTESSRAPEPAPAVESREERAAGGALFDKKNLYTLVIANYGKTRDDYAWATYDHLVESGVDVFRPVERADDILILAGAAPRVADLARLKDLVQGLPGWDGNSDAYATAYVAGIDSLIDR